MKIKLVNIIEKKNPIKGPLDPVISAINISINWNISLINNDYK